MITAYPFISNEYIEVLFHYRFWETGILSPYSAHCSNWISYKHA